MTTETKHTPEPWRYHGKLVVGGEPEFLIADCANTPDTFKEDQANARRIVACVNLLKGYSTEHIETGKVKVTP